MDLQTLHKLEIRHQYNTPAENVSIVPRGTYSIAWQACFLRASFPHRQLPCFRLKTLIPLLPPPLSRCCQQSLASKNSAPKADYPLCRGCLVRLIHMTIPERVEQERDHGQFYSSPQMPIAQTSTKIGRNFLEISIN